MPILIILIKLLSEIRISSVELNSILLPLEGIVVLCTFEDLNGGFCSELFDVIIHVKSN